MAISSSLSYLDNAGSGNVTATPGPLTLNYVILGAGANGIKAATNLDDGATTANTLTFTGTGGITAPLFNATTVTGTYQIAGVNVLALPDGDTTSIAVGELALHAQSATGSNNVAVGYEALYSNTSGTNNVALGSQALYTNTTGGTNAAIGTYALNTNLSGSNNFAFGYQALYLNSTGSNNVGVGNQSLLNNTSSENVGVGTSTLFTNTSGTANVGLGYQALYTNLSGSNNLGIGYQAIYNNSTGGNNIGVGSQALLNVTGGNNTCIGVGAGAAITSGTNCVIIGYNSNTSGNDSNEIVIGATATGAGSNTGVIGNGSTTDVYFGSSSPAANVRAAGYYAGATAGVSAGPFTTVTGITTIKGIVTALSGTSDERLKDWVPYTGGLAEILAITPASYHWNEKGTAQTGLPSEQEYVGFIAQDVQRSIPQAITATEPSRTTDETYLSLDDRPIIACLVNCIKELHERIKVLEAE